MAKRKIKQIGAVSVYRDSEWDEYVVRIGGNPETDYFTDDKDDAFKTAEAIAKQTTTPCEG